MLPTVSKEPTTRLQPFVIPFGLFIAAILIGAILLLAAVARTTDHDGLQRQEAQVAAAILSNWSMKFHAIDEGETNVFAAVVRLDPAGGSGMERFDAATTTALITAAGRRRNPPRPIIIGEGDDTTALFVSRRQAGIVDVGVLPLDAAFWRRLGTEFLIEGPKLVPTSAGLDAGAWVPLLSADGRVAGEVSFIADRPGARITKALAPLLAGSGLVLLCLALVVARQMRRAAAAHEAEAAQKAHLALHDPLTGLANRALFEDRLKHALAMVRRTGTPIALHYLDLDRFKFVNDTFGHQAGDELIREFGGRLKQILRSSDTVARLGGDEFAIIQMDVGGPSAVHALGRRIIEEVGKPFAVLGNEAHVGVSIGVAITPETGIEAAELVRKADIALYEAKTGGRNRLQVFQDSMDASLLERRRLEGDLKTALAEGRDLSLRFQPVYRAEGLRLVGVEALVRWNHPSLGTLPPATFVPIAEETGLIGPLGDFVLREAAKVVAPLPGLFLAVNVSSAQLRHPDYAARVAAILAETGLSPSRLEIEITEKALIDDPVGMDTCLRALHALGVRLALDDFGTGYSSLSHLRDFAVDTIKIDRTFVHALGRGGDNGAITAAIIELARAMNRTVSAEAVETEEQFRFLSAAGCDRVQGFLFSPPIAAEEIAVFRDRLWRRRGNVVSIESLGAA